MKRITLLFFVTFLVISVFGQNADKKWGIGLGAGYYMPRQNNLDDNNKSHNKKGGFTSELYLSRFISPSFDVYLKENLGLKKIENVGGNIGATTVLDISNLALNLRYKFLKSPAAKIQPYIFAGPTYLVDNVKNISFNAGLGSKFPLGENIALYIDGAYFRGLDNTGVGPSPDYQTFNYRDDFMKVTAGLEFAFGAPKDTDGDGVPDRKDKCPGTPAGVKVDLNGCPLDRDGDGIPDYKDDCPDTPGLAAFNGCPDKDGDGIMDKEDDCPDVPGLKQFKGCPDTDGDGVPDPKDECPNTPKGCKVDMKGCPIDTDKDGIIDCEDKCPDVPGLRELQGCPVICKDFEVDPVYFDFDKSNLRPEGIAALDAFIKQLGDCKEYDIVVNGYTCNIGTKKYNMGLSERRSQEVVKYLISNGINNAFIAGKGYGEENPAVPNTSNANREKNRRAVIDLTVK